MYGTGERPSDRLISGKLREGAALDRARARWGTAGRSDTAPEAQSSEKSMHAVALVQGLQSYGAPRDGRPGALYIGLHPNRDGRKVLLHARPDGAWTTYEARADDGSDAAVLDRGVGHNELAAHLRRWRSQ